MDRPPTAQVAPVRRGFAADAVWLAAGSGVSGLAAYAFAAIGSRALGPATFAPVSVLWTAWAITAAAIAFPLQHWVIRRFHADGGDAGIRSAMPALMLIALGLAAVTGAAGWLAREDLFRRDGIVFPVYLSVIVFGAAIIGLLRGSLAARDRFGATAAVLAGENLIRVGLAAAGAAAGWDEVALGGALIAGFTIAAFWPRALPLGRAAARAPRQLGFLMGIAGGAMLAQMVLTGGPIALALLGAREDRITTMFVALALFRAPYIVATGIASRITGTLTRLVVGSQRARLRRVVLVTLAATLGAAGIGALTGAVAGPAAIAALFGAAIDTPRPVAAVIGAGSGVALGTLMLNLLLVSRASTGALTTAWAAALAASVAWSIAGPGEPLHRVAVAFLIGEAVALAAMLGSEARALREQGEEVEGSLLAGL